jgi:hypothetical protein
MGGDDVDEGGIVGDAAEGDAETVAVVPRIVVSLDDVFE